MARLTDVQIVARAIGEHYGRTLDRIASPTSIARAFIADVAAAGRLGDSPAQPSGWEPSAEDAYDLGGGLANHFGTMRLWRAEEIGYHAVRALGRAGRLLPAAP